MQPTMVSSTINIEYKASVAANARLIGTASDREVEVELLIMTQALRLATEPPIFFEPAKTKAKLQTTRACARIMEYRIAPAMDTNGSKLPLAVLLLVETPFRQLKAKKRSEKAVALAERMIRELQT